MVRLTGRRKKRERKGRAGQGGRAVQGRRNGQEQGARIKGRYERVKEGKKEKHDKFFIPDNQNK